MTKVRRFGDLHCWQKARQLANAVSELTMHPGFARDFGLRDQIQQAAGSVMHNIAEGHDASSDPEFIRFLKIARRSCSEVQSELYLALDRAHITEGELEAAYGLADAAKRLINGLIAYLRKTHTDTLASDRVQELPEAYAASQDDMPERHPSSEYPARGD